MLSYSDSITKNTKYYVEGKSRVGLLKLIFLITHLNRFFIRKGVGVNRL